MSSTTSLSYVLRERPIGNIIPGQTFEAVEEPTPTAESLSEGDVLTQTLYLSVDPGYRGFLSSKDKQQPQFPLGTVMPGGVVARVLSSRSKKFNPGDLVTLNSGWRETAVTNDKEVQSVSLPPKASHADLLGILGVNGLTAYFGLTKVADIKEGDTVVISSAAGATGSIVGQMARAYGAGTIIGIAGSDEKCRWLTKELGFDFVLNYKDPNYAQRLEDATPNLIDVYWDAVGGELLDIALSRAAVRSRFVICGGIAGYNRADPPTMRNLSAIMTRRIKIQGFTFFDYAAENADAVKELHRLHTEGKIKGKTTVYKGGLRNIENAWLKLFAGENIGKTVLEVKEP